jgi:hypothetical protein
MFGLSKADQRLTILGAFLLLFGVVILVASAIAGSAVGVSIGGICGVSGTRVLFVAIVHGSSRRGIDDEQSVRHYLEAQRAEHEREQLKP